MFSGTIPTEIGALTKRDALLLDDNDFTGTIPTELDNVLVQSRGTCQLYRYRYRYRLVRGFTSTISYQ
jgi:hypothetical protein